MQRISTKKPTPPARPTLEATKGVLDTSATTNRNLFVAFTLLLVSALTLCLSISDEQLLIGSAPLPLLLGDLQLPIWAFASVVPLLVMVLHFDLMHNLNEHRRKLQAWLVAWEERYPPADAGKKGKQELAASDQLHPFLYDYAWLHANGKGPRNINVKLLPALCWALYCWAPYTVLMIFFIRFAPLQSYFFTAWHLLLILLDVAWVFWYWQHFGQGHARFWLWRWLRRVVNLRVLLLGVTTLVGCWTLGLVCLIHMHIDMDLNCQNNEYVACPEDLVKAAIKFEENQKAILGITLVPRLVVPNFRVKLDNEHFQIAELLEPGKSHARLLAKTATSLNLSSRRFGFADFSSAVMPKVDFSNANLKGAKMDKANLMGSNFSNANLQKAEISSAELKGSYFRETKLQGANLKATSLRGAILQGTLLQGAILEMADLRGADLRKAQLVGTNISKAQLQGAALNGANLLNIAPRKQIQNIDDYGEPIDKNLFASEWLKTACSSDFLAETMIMTDVKGPPPAITDIFLGKQIHAYPDCKPYIDLAERAIKLREAQLSMDSLLLKYRP